MKEDGRRPCAGLLPVTIHRPRSSRRSASCRYFLYTAIALLVVLTVVFLSCGSFWLIHKNIYLPLSDISEVTLCVPCSTLPDNSHSSGLMIVTKTSDGRSVKYCNCQIRRDSTQVNKLLVYLFVRFQCHAEVIFSVCFGDN